MKKLIALFLCLMLPACALAADYTVGICQFHSHSALDKATQGFKDALTQKLGEDKVEFLFTDAAGQLDACAQAVADFTAKPVSLILANATPALQAAANSTVDLPIVGVSVSDYGSTLDISDFDGLVGSNITGVSDLTPLDTQARMLHEVFPEAKTIGLLYCSSEPNSAYQVKEVWEYFLEAGLECTLYPFADEADAPAVTKTCAEASDVIFVPTDNVVADCAEMISEAALAAKTPIVGGDLYICRDLGVVCLSADYYQLGLMAGDMAAQILTGESESAKMPIAYAPDYMGLYNPENCEAFGVDVARLESMGFVNVHTVE